MLTHEIANIQKYLRQKFTNNNIVLDMKENRDDSIQVKLGEEFIGVIYKDVEDGETSYNFNMAILDIDLDEVA